MTAKERVLNVESQVRAIVAGERAEIFCPFCGLVTSGGVEVLCCNELSEVVLAVLNHIEFKRQTEILEQTMDRLSAVSEN